MVSGGEVGFESTVLFLCFNPLIVDIYEILYLSLVLARDPAVVLPIPDRALGNTDYFSELGLR